MRVEDIEEVCRLAKQSGLENWKFSDYSDEINKPGSFPLTAIYKNKLVGFVIARLIMQIYSNSNNELNSKIKAKNIKTVEIEIYNIAVSENHRNKNIGTQLIKKLLENILCIRKETRVIVWLEVRQSNFRAINFYKKNNFELQYTRKKLYIHPTEDAVVMKSEVKNF